MSANPTAASPTIGAEAQSAAPITLTLRRDFPARREIVFAAFTEPERVREWFGPKGFTVPEARIDLRVGGVYRITMRSPDGNDHTVTGVYKEISPPERLVFTWAWATGEMDDADTLVTLIFRDKGETTELILAHEGFPTEDLRDRHNQGWSSSFVCLEKLFA